MYVCVCRIVLEQKREARRAKLVKRLTRNLKTNTLSTSSIDALTGTGSSKKPARAAPHVGTAPVLVKQAAVKRETTAPAAKPQAVKQQVKPTYRQTATSQKQADMALSKPRPPPATTQTKKPAAITTKTFVTLKKKLTVPQSPNFSVRRQTVAKHPVARVEATAPSTATVVDGNTSGSRRSSITWTVPFTPERPQQPPNSPRTPIGKIFFRKSFSETKSPVRKVPAVPVPMIRSSSSNSLARLSRPNTKRSVAFASSTSTSRFSRSFFDIPQQLSEG